MAGLGVVSAETVPRMSRLGSCGVLPAEVEAPGPIRVSYRRVSGIAPVLAGAMGVETDWGWKEVEVE